MGYTNFPNGITSFGIPIFGNNGGISIPTGNNGTGTQGQVWFVDAVNGSDGQTGTSPSSAFASIEQALDVAGDGTGDTIYVAPGSYTENLVVDKDFISIIGSI